MVFEFPSQSRWASTSPFARHPNNRFVGSSHPTGSIGRLPYLNSRNHLPPSFSPSTRIYPSHTLPYSTVHDFHRGQSNRSYSPTDCYEDLDFFYERPPEPDGNKERAKNSTATTRSVDSSSSPPPLPPLPADHPQSTIANNTSRKCEYVEESVLKKPKEPTKCGLKLYLLVALLVFISLFLACSIIGVLWYAQERQQQSRDKQQEPSQTAPFSMDKILGVLSSHFRPNKPEKERVQDGGNTPKSLFNHSLYRLPSSLLDEEWEEKEVHNNKKGLNGGSEALIEPNHLLTLLITKRKVCIFEASTSEVDVSRQEFRSSHLPTARLLLFSSLSHNGVPVHPLQFQRYVRSLGLDQDCHIVIYSRHELVFATYGFWIFKLYGHSKISILNGGFQAWKSLADQGKGPYTLENSAPDSLEPQKLGDFKARWQAEHIVTFDDVFANFESHDNDLVDAQSEEEFQGKPTGPVIFGHIRTAMNIPSQTLLSNGTWLALEAQQDIFHSKGLSEQRPVIVYDGTSIHSTMVWFGLHRLGYTPAVYFGSWPEWIIRAPDYLKVIPSGE